MVLAPFVKLQAQKLYTTGEQPLTLLERSKILIWRYQRTQMASFLQKFSEMWNITLDMVKDVTD